MLELGKIDTWEPPELSENEIVSSINICKNLCRDNENPDKDYLVFFKTTPYIDAVYLHFEDEALEEPEEMIRFPIHEGFFWSTKDNRTFISKCLNNPRCVFSGSDIDNIMNYYSKTHPEWHLKPYYSEKMKLLDHIYHCMQSGTIKEILYKAGLDNLAASSDKIDEVDLFSTKPSDIYPGLSMRTLRALNCKEGSKLVNTAEHRDFIKELQHSSPDMFKDELNNAQCRYICDLIDHRLTVNEIGRLFMAAKERLSRIWCDSQYELFTYTEKARRQRLEKIERINEIDPIYRAHMPQDPDSLTSKEYNYERLAYYLLTNRHEYDLAIRRSNRKRDPDWQERTKEYIIRYPQTVNDFFREAVYMKNCLSGYIEAVINNETNILFMRKADDVNMPFITIEIHKGVLFQAYHRFNKDCTPEEAAWIREYCDRHGILVTYKFERNIDMQVLPEL